MKKENDSRMEETNFPKKKRIWYKRVILFLAVCAFLMCGFIVFCAKIEEISSQIESWKRHFFAIEWHPTKVDFSQYQPLTDEEDAWYLHNELIAHACGGIDGKTYTNSKDALEKSAADGHKVIETDFLMTSDNHVVLRHEWSQYFEQNNIGASNIPDYDTFMKEPINYKYAPLDIESMLTFLSEHEDVYLVTDTKDQGEAMVNIYQSVVDTAESMDMLDVLDRFIVQIYYEEDLQHMKDVYPFQNWIYTLYSSGSRDFDGIARFCLENDIHVVTMPVGWISSGEYIAVFDQMNIHVFTNTVNTLSDFRNLKGKTVDGIYTDFLIPSDLQYIEE